MATFNTVEELIQILDDNPHWLEALRARLLTRELLELPQRHAEFVVLSERRHAITEANFMEVHSDMSELSRKHDRSVERSEQIHREIMNDLGMLKGLAIESAVFRLADDVAIELGMRRVNSLSVNQLVDMAESTDTTGMFDSPQSRRDNLRSFRRADLIMEARDPDSETCYIAVEASYTVNGRDTRRALRNAEYLERFTQKKAYAVVAGVRLDDRIREDVESGRVFWYEIEEHMMRHD